MAYMEWARATGKIRRYRGVEILSATDEINENSGKVNSKKEENKIQSGFQLFNTFRVGYHIEFFNHLIFIEPSTAMTWWPINTNLPGSFQAEEDKWNNYVK